MPQLEELLTSSSTQNAVKLARMALGVAIVAHLLACGWGWIGRNHEAIGCCCWRAGAEGSGLLRTTNRTGCGWGLVGRNHSQALREVTDCGGGLVGRIHASSRGWTSTATATTGWTSRFGSGNDVACQDLLVAYLTIKSNDMMDVKRPDGGHPLSVDWALAREVRKHQYSCHKSELNS